MEVSTSPSSISGCIRRCVIGSARASSGIHQGWGTGVGVSYGYDWAVGKHWNIEASIGVGYLYLESDKYPCANCGTKIETVKKHYFGPTQAAVSAVYLF